MKKSTSILILMLLICVSAFPQTRIKTLFYNLLYYPSGDPQNREVILKNILDTYQPDIFTVCELETVSGADEILTQSIQISNPNFNRAQFLSNQSDSSADNQLQQMLYYDTTKFTLVYQQVHTTYIRDINQYTLLLNTENQDTDPIIIEYFVSHFKASNSAANENIRLDMANVFTNVLAGLDADTFVVFSGDFNFYTSSEPAYQEILDPTNAIVMLDPINDNTSVQNWHNNSTYRAVHTQATRVNQLNGNGAYSGMDDRFDFSFISENLNTSTDLFYVSGSYNAYGNNGNCYDLDINDASCTGTYSQSLRNNLYTMSDHIPVVMELETPQNILGIDDYAFKNNLSIIGSNLITETVSIQISTDLFNSDLFIYNQMGQLVKTIKTSTNLQILTDVSNLSNGIYVITPSGKKLVNPIKFMKSN